MHIKRFRFGIISGYALLAIILVAIGCILFFSAHRLSNDISNLSQKPIHKNELVHQIGQSSLRIQLLLQKHIEANDSTQRKIYEDEIRNQHKANDIRLVQLTNLIEPHSKQQTILDSLLLIRTEYQLQREELIRLNYKNRDSALAFNSSKQIPAFNKYSETLDSLSENILNSTHEKAKLMTDFISAELMIVNILMVLLMIILLAIGSMMWIAQKRLKDKNKALLESKNTIQNIYDSLIDAVIIIDEQGMITKWDTKSETLFGWKESEVIGKKLFETIIPERYSEMHNNGMKHYLDKGEAHVFGKTLELSVLNKNGHEFDVSLNITPVQLNKEQHFIGFIRDISDKKKADEKIKADKVKYRSVVENIHESLLIEDLDGNLVYANSEFTKMFGFQPEEFKNLSFKDYVSAQSYIEVLERHNKRKNGIAVPNEFEYKGKRKDGKEIWVECRVSTLFENGKMVGTQSLELDITERKNAESTLSKSEKFSRGVLSSLNAHIAVVDQTGLIIEVNQAWDEFANDNGIIALDRTGKGSNYFEVCKKSAAEGDTIAAQALKGIQEVLNKNKSEFYLEYPCHSPIEQRWFLMRVQNFESEKPMIVVAHQNITELKASEEKLRASETQYRRLFEASKDGIFILNADTGVIEDVNPFMIEMLGYSFDEFMGKHLWEISLFKDIAANKDAFQELKKEHYIRYDNLPPSNQTWAHHLGRVCK